jgi:hypothetical protein
MISSGGKPSLGATTKQGNPYIRKLLVLGNVVVKGGEQAQRRFARLDRGIAR